MIIFTDGRTPWTGDQLVARPLSKHRTTQTQNKRKHTPNIHALTGIRTHDPGFRASEDSTRLKPLGYRDRRYTVYVNLNLITLIYDTRETSVRIQRGESLFHVKLTPSPTNSTHK
jgi:hypothetical protein